MRIIRIYIILALLFALIASCATVPKEEPPVQEPLEPREQQSLAMKKFNAMLEDSRTLPLNESRGLMEDGYNEIIDKYPKSVLAEEAYYRLIRMYFRDFVPVRLDDVDKLYNEYFDNYPNPKFANAINEDITMFLYKNHEWERLHAFTIPFMEALVKTGKYGKSLYLFYYTEAKYNLGDYAEAYKGYEQCSIYYKDESIKAQSKKRLKELRRYFSQKPQENK